MVELHWETENLQPTNLFQTDTRKEGVFVKDKAGQRRKYREKPGAGMAAGNTDREARPKAKIHPLVGESVCVHTLKNLHKILTFGWIPSAPPVRTSFSVCSQWQHYVTDAKGSDLNLQL